jgi:pullulanase-type alpha-1,6-glucosidase
MNKKQVLQNCFAVLVAGLILFSPISTLTVWAQESEAPETVTIAGTLQSELGCSGDWMPGCELTSLVYDANSDVWSGTFNVTPGNDQDKNGPRYKAALNGSWDVNYGKNASRGGSDIPLVVDASIDVSFYFDNKSHLIADDYTTPIITATGDFQTQLGCAADNDPVCLRGWLQDTDGDGSYAFVTKSILAGEYTVTFSISQKTITTTTDPVTFTVPADNTEIYFGYDMVKKEVIVSTSGAPKGSLAKQKAMWVNQDTLIWNVVGSPRYTYAIFYSPSAELALTASGVDGGEMIPLSFSKAGPGGDVLKDHPYLSGYSAFKIDAAEFGKIPQALRSQLAVIVIDDKGKVVDATGIQTAGALDAVYGYDGSLGITFEETNPVIRVWAPSALTVRLQLFDDSTVKTFTAVNMTRDDSTGVWSAVGDPGWLGKYYLYEVEVYVPKTGKIEKNLVTDPYSVSLSMNSQRSQIMDLGDTALKPNGWDTLAKPTLAAPEDSVIYELHIRDFSISDPIVPEALRGTYKAFTIKNSLGMQHLRRLAMAGLTTVHLLPAFDIASVDEDKSTWSEVNKKNLASYAPDSDQQALAVSLIKGTDGFNWGYDPYHYTTPEGSYSTNPDGSTRVREFREMVQSLNTSNLRVVMDVVYNHTSQSGQDAKSVLDKIVPGYYHRLDTEGNVTTSTCCQNNATENRMMEKLMIDSVVTWAREYKVDGFRFDLMGHHMLSNMQAVRAALDALTLETDGVDGKSIYIYGEGWDFGEVENNARGVNATQLNIGGTGIGVFNDRLRDGVRGGNPFDDPRLQGFSTGLGITPNAVEIRTPEAQVEKLLDYTNWIKIGMAGNLSAYTIVKANGDLVDGAHVLYGGKPAGYTLDPQENIVYVSAHDNETLFDAIQLKASAETGLQERIRMNNLALSIPMLSQGIPFFHAGDDILRSKSLDKNSYDSGDWYNRIDWSYSSNNWGVGLPTEGSSNWEFYKPLLADKSLAPIQGDITNAAVIFREFLAIRKSSPLFRLQTADQVMRMVSFLNNGPEQQTGLIVMNLEDLDNLDAKFSEIVVIVNANPESVTFSDPSFQGKAYTLHPVQQNSYDRELLKAKYNSSSSTFTVPGITTAVFVIEKPETTQQNGRSGKGLSTPALVAVVVGTTLMIAVILYFAVFRKKKAG